MPETENVATIVATLQPPLLFMALPSNLPSGKTSHTLKTRVPRYLWHDFLKACKIAGYDSASAALRDLMRDFIRKTRMEQKKRTILGRATRKKR